MKTFEDLIDEMGGMSRFQVINTLLVTSCQLTIGWSMLQMSYAGLIPDFTCVLDEVSQGIANHGNDTLNVCSINETSCSGYIFHGSDKTVMTEWGLVCDKKSTKTTIISIQMTGVLIGAILAGQMSDLFGRRKTPYFFVLMHASFNILAAFSSSWEMFTALRFFIGIGMGAVLVIVLPYTLEFLPNKWRPIQGVLPSWTLGVGLFSVACVTLKNWSHLHIACGLLSLPSFFGCLFVPESIRWLAIKGRIKEANKVVEKISTVNRKPLPESTGAVIQQIMLRERQSREENKKYSYLDLFRGLRQAKISLILGFFWFCMATVFYGISFGVVSLSGNLYINIFLLGILDIPVQTTTFCLNNKFGRRATSFFFFFLSALCCIGCVIAYYSSPEDVRGPAINGLSLTAKMMTGAAWSAVSIWGSELFPTVIRNVGYGFMNTGARIGGLVAPFIIDLSSRMGLSYCIMSGLFVACVVLCLFLEETKGAVLEDSLRNNLKQGQTMEQGFEEKTDDVEPMDGHELIYQGTLSTSSDTPEKI